MIGDLSLQLEKGGCISRREACYRLFCRALVVMFIVSLLATAGCGSGNPTTYPVRGQVTYPNGMPVTVGMVEFEPMPREGVSLTERLNARGLIHPDGTYFLTTFKDGDGAVPGRHRVIVHEPNPEADVEEGEFFPKGPISPPPRHTLRRSGQPSPRLPSERTLFVAKRCLVGIPRPPVRELVRPRSWLRMEWRR